MSVVVVVQWQCVYDGRSSLSMSSVAVASKQCVLKSYHCSLLQCMCVCAWCVFVCVHVCAFVCVCVCVCVQHTFLCGFWLMYMVNIFVCLLEYCVMSMCGMCLHTNFCTCLTVNVCFLGTYIYFLCISMFVNCEGP